VRTPPLPECPFKGLDFCDLLVGRALQQELGYDTAYVRQPFAAIC
jgi:hypothetical protein